MVTEGYETDDALTVLSCFVYKHLFYCKYNFYQRSPPTVPVSVASRYDPVQQIRYTGGSEVLAVISYFLCQTSIIIIA